MTPERLHDLRAMAVLLGEPPRTALVACLDEIETLRKRVEELEKMELMEAEAHKNTAGVLNREIERLEGKLSKAKVALEKIAKLNSPDDLVYKNITREALKRI